MEKKDWSKNIFSQIQGTRQDRSYYKNLYNFNMEAELAEYSLPFINTLQNPKKKMPPGVINSTQLPPLS